jgi:hypothetical protein
MTLKEIRRRSLLRQRSCGSEKKFQEKVFTSMACNMYSPSPGTTDLISNVIMEDLRENDYEAQTEGGPRNTDNNDLQTQVQ